MSYAIVPHPVSPRRPLGATSTASTIANVLWVGIGLLAIASLVAVGNEFVASFRAEQQ